jgi:hypothetical protein
MERLNCRCGHELTLCVDAYATAPTTMADGELSAGADEFALADTYDGLYWLRCEGCDWESEEQQRRLAALLEAALSDGASIAVVPASR